MAVGSFSSTAADESDHNRLLLRECGPRHARRLYRAAAQCACLGKV